MSSEAAVVNDAANCAVLSEIILELDHIRFSKVMS